MAELVVGSSRRSPIIHRALRDAVRWGHIPRIVADLADPPRDGSPEKAVWFSERCQRSWPRPVRTSSPACGVWPRQRACAAGSCSAGVDLEGASIDIRQNLVVVNHSLTVSDPKTAAGRWPSTPRRWWRSEPSGVLPEEFHEQRPVVFVEPAGRPQSLAECVDLTTESRLGLGLPSCRWISPEDRVGTVLANRAYVSSSGRHP